MEESQGKVDTLDGKITIAVRGAAFEGHIIQSEML